MIWMILGFMSLLCLDWAIMAVPSIIFIVYVLVWFLFAWHDVVERTRYIEHVCMALKQRNREIERRLNNRLFDDEYVSNGLSSRKEDSV